MRSRKEPGAVPLSDVFESRGLCLVPFVNCRFSNRVVQVSDTLPRTGAESDRRVGGPKGRRADLGYRRAEALREHCHAVDVAELALIGAETERRIALDVLDILIAFAHREMHVGYADVCLEIQELLGTAFRIL